MSDERTTEILEAEYAGTEYLASDYSDNIDIASPKQYLITTGAKKCMMTIRVKAAATATVALNKDVVLGTGGSMSAGSALTLVKRDQSFIIAPVTVIAKDYILGSSDQSAGTAIVTEYQLASTETVVKFRLAESKKYGLIFTSIADNNIASFHFEFEEV